MFPDKTSLSKQLKVQIILHPKHEQTSSASIPELWHHFNTNHTADIVLMSLSITLTVEPQW